MQCYAVSSVRIAAGVSLRLHRGLQILHMIAQYRQPGHQRNETHSRECCTCKFSAFLEIGKIVDEWTRKDANLNAGKYPFPALSNGDLTR